MCHSEIVRTVEPQGLKPWAAEQLEAPIGILGVASVPLLLLLQVEKVRMVSGDAAKDLDSEVAPRTLNCCIRNKDH